MKLIFVLIFFFFSFSIKCYSQNIFAFFEYDIKNGMTDQFVNGYKADLEWQKSKGDDWSWVGWFVSNGDRRGRFIDATPNHNWTDFDQWKINGTENARYNKIHWTPYVENPSGSYKKILTDFSFYQDDWLKSKYLQVYYIEIKNGDEENFKNFLSSYKPFLQNQLNNNSFVWMKTISGGSTSEYSLFITLSKMEDFSLYENLFDFSDSTKELQENYRASVDKNKSELWSYSELLSLFSDEK